MVHEFLNYVINEYLGEDSPKGDLAKDMQKVKNYLLQYAGYNISIFSDFDDE